MPNVIRIKRRTSGATGAPASLKSGELAYNNMDNTVYAGFGDDGSGNATSVKPVGGEGTFALLASPALTGTPTAPTAAVDTNTTQLATTAFVVGQGYAKLASPTLTGTPAAPTAAANTNTTQIATTAFVLGQANSTAGTIAMDGAQSAGTSNLYARADHVHPTDTSRAALASPTFTGTPAAPTAVADTNTTQLATTAFVVAQAGSATPLINGTAAVGTSLRYARQDHVHPNQRIDQLLTPTADVAFGTRKITGLGDPTNPQDAATKFYVDSVAQGIDAKQSVKAATTANITLSGAQTIDGVSVIAGDRVLVKNQTAPAENGIFVVAAGAWTRATDMDTWAEVPSSFVFVEQGTTNADTSWVCSSDAGGTLDTTSIVWFQFGSASAYLGGNGLVLTGNTFDVVGTANRIVANADSIDIAATYVGQTSITTLGTITTGVWNGTTIAVANGGTGAVTLTGLVKGNGTSAFTAAVAGTDYHDTNSTIDGGTF